VESDSERIIGLYDRHALAYVADRRVAGWNEGPWLDRFAALLPRGAPILDIGCGFGEPIATYLIDQGFAVSGVDSSPTLIALCRGRFPLRPWHVADMRTLALEETFDGLLAWDSFFHLNHDDQRRMFAVFKRLASPHAALMFTSGGSHGEAIGSYRGEPLYHASLAPPEYRALLSSIGFRVVEHVVDDPACGGHTVWLAKAGH
jgi:SAM-dependent methyltransferase